MPTVPTKATPIPDADCSREEYVQRALEMLANTSQTDVTGQPAMRDVKRSAGWYDVDWSGLP